MSIKRYFVYANCTKEKIGQNLWVKYGIRKCEVVGLQHKVLGVRVFLGKFAATFSVFNGELREYHLRLHKKIFQAAKLVLRTIFLCVLYVFVLLAIV